MNEYLQQLIELSKQNSKQIEIDLKIFESTFDGVLKNAPDKDRDVLEKMNALTKKAIILAKDGKTNEANEILNQIKNECKSNK